MPPKISLFSGQKRKRDNDLTNSTSPSVTTNNNAPSMLISPPSSQNSSKKLRLNVTPRPAKNPFRTTTTPTTSLTPPKVSLFSNFTKKGQHQSAGGLHGSQSSATSLTPPKISLFSKFTKRKVESHSQTQSQNETKSDFPNPFRQGDHHQHESAAPTSSPNNDIRLKVKNQHYLRAKARSFSPSPPNFQAELDIGITLRNAILLKSASAEPETPSRHAKFRSHPRVLQSPSPDRTISAHSDRADHSDHSISQEDAGYLSSSPEPETIPSQPWTPKPDLLAALKAADEQELQESKEKLSLLKMQLSWSIMGGVEHDDLRGLGKEIPTLEKRSRNLERKLGLREDDYEDEWTPDTDSGTSVAEDEVEAIS